jgi:hypothetical protein
MVAAETLKILLVCANPRGSSPLRTAAEDRTLRESVQLSPNRSQIEVETLNAATVDDLRRALLRNSFDVVHFSGHGSPSGLSFEDANGTLMVAPAGALADLLVRRQVRVALLNACYSMSVGRIVAFGTEHTIASSGPISDPGAIEFTRGFYDALGAGTTVPDAYHEGLSAAHLKGFTLDAVLLGRGEEYVFPAPETDSSADPDVGLRGLSEPPPRTLLAVAVDVSGSMQRSIRNRRADDQSRFESVRDALADMGAQLRDEVLRRPDALPDSFRVFVMGFGLRMGDGVADLASLWKAAENVDLPGQVEVRKARFDAEARGKASAYGDIADLARGWGFGGIVDSFTEAAKSTARSQIAGELTDLVLAEAARIGDSTLTAPDLARMFEGGSDASDLQVLEQVIFGLTPMAEVADRIRRRLDRSDSRDEQRTLLVISDGEPTDGDPRPAFAAIAASGVNIVSSFVTDDDIANPRLLVGTSESSWSTGARLMWDIASPLDESSAAAKYLLRQGWSIELGARMFVQVNHSDVLKEFVRVAAGYFSPQSSLLLPRGQ